MAQSLWPHAARATAVAPFLCLALLLATGAPASGRTLSAVPEFSTNSSAAVVSKAPSASAPSYPSLGSSTQGTYFTTKISGNARCIDIPVDSSANGVALQQFGCNNSPAQIFTMTDTGSNWYSMSQGGRSWDVTGASDSSGALIQMWTTNNQENQQFGLFNAPGDDYGDDSYYIKARHSMKCVDVRYSNTGNGAAIWQWDCNGGDSQVFTPHNVGSDYAPPSPDYAPPGTGYFLGVGP